MIRRIRPCPRLRGDITAASDKSISHRAIIFNTIAQGQATVRNLSRGEDCLSTIACLKALGADIQVDPHPAGDVVIRGAGKEGLREAADVLSAGNSGTTMRLLSGLLAAQPFLSILTGDSSLRSRPMGRIIQPLRQMGAEIWGRRGDTLAPLAIRGGSLRGINYKMPVASAQLKSSLLIAALFASGKTVIEEPAPSRDHTELMLGAMGASLQRDGNIVGISPLDRELRAIDLVVPGDISGSACWLIAAAIHPDARLTVKNVGINATRTGVIDVLRAMGADLKIENERRQGDEPVADVVVRSSRLHGIDICGEIIPRLIDELPLLALAACLADGATAIRDAGELRVKESDRISTTVSELSRLGAHIEELPDGMRIMGGKRLRGTTCSSHDDHRLAMVLGIAGLVAAGETIIQGADAVVISYPSFWQELDSVCQGGDHSSSHV